MSLPKKKVVISEFMDDAAVQALGDHFDVVYQPGLVDDRAALHNAVRDAHALIVRNRTQVDREVLAAGPALRVVGRLGVGLDNIDLQTCKESNVKVIPATGANAQAVAEYVIASAMTLWRGSFFASSEVASGAWPRTRLSSGREIHGRSLGLVGFGGIGQRVARLAQGLGMSVLAYDPFIPADAPVWTETKARSVSMDELVAQADIISLHIPVTPDTQNLFGTDVLAQMRPGSVLINTSRGGIVDEAALADALRSGHLSGAALDVFSQEPLPRSPHFDDVPGLVLTPHVAGVTHESNERVSSMIANSIIEFLNNDK